MTDPKSTDEHRLTKLRTVLKIVAQLSSLVFAASLFIVPILLVRPDISQWKALLGGMGIAGAIYEMTKLAIVRAREDWEADAWKRKAAAREDESRFLAALRKELEVAVANIGQATTQTGNGDGAAKTTAVTPLGKGLN